MANDTRKKLFQALNDAGYDIGSYDDFDRRMNNPSDQKKFFNAVSNAGYDIGDENEFYRRITPTKYHLNIGGKEKPVSEREFRDFASRHPNKVVSRQAKDAAMQKWGPQNLKRPVDYSKPGALISSMNEQQEETNNALMQPVREISKVAKNNKFTPQTDEEGNKIFPVMPKEVARDEELKIKGSVFDSGTLDKMSQDAKSKFEQDLSKAQQKQQQAYSDMSDGLKYMSMYGRFGTGGLAQIKVADPYDDPDVKNRLATLRLLQNGEALKNAARATQDKGAFGQIAHGFKETVKNPGTWDMGQADLNVFKSLFDAAEKFDNGQPLTDSEKDLLNSAALYSAYENEYSGQIGSSVKAGQVTANAIPFMLEMAANPEAGAGKALQKQVVKEGMKKLVKDMAQSVIKKTGRKEAAKQLGKGAAARLGGDILGAAAMAGTTGVLGVEGSFYDRKQGQTKYGVKDGEVQYAGREGGDATLSALGKAFADRWTENYSEMVGAYFSPMAGMAGKVVEKGLKAMKLGKVVDLVKGLGSTGVARVLDNALEKTQWNGVFEEYAEEVVGNAINAALVGDMTFDASETGVFNPKQNLETLYSVALMGGVFSAVRTAGYGYNVLKDNREVAIADAVAFDTVKDWENIKKEVNTAKSDEEMLDKLNNIVQNTTDINEKTAILRYAAAKAKLRGTLYGEQSARQEQFIHEQAQRPSQIKEDGNKVTITNSQGEVLGEREIPDEEDRKVFIEETKINRSNQDLLNDYARLERMSQDLRADIEAGNDIELSDSQMDSIRQSVAARFLADGKPFENIMEDMGKEGTAEYDALQQAITEFDPLGDVYRQTELQFDIEEDELTGIIRKDPLKRTAEEQEIASFFAQKAHEAAYQKGELHPEQSFADGQDLADNLNIGEGDTNAPVGLQQQKDQAERSLNELLKNKDFADIWKRLKDVSPDDVIMFSYGFISDAETKALIDYFNTMAKYNGFIAKTEQRINDYVNNETRRRMFWGTINGNPSTDNLLTINHNGNNYTLVNGNVTLDNDNRIVASDDNTGVLVVLNENGDMEVIQSEVGMQVVEGMPVSQFINTLTETVGADITEQLGAQPQKTEQAEETTEEPQEEQQEETVEEQEQPEDFDYSQQTDIKSGYDNFLRYNEGDEEMSMELAESELSDAKDSLKKIDKEKVPSGVSMQEKKKFISERNQRKREAQKRVDFWNGIIEENKNRKEEAERLAKEEAERIKAEEEARRKAEEELRRQEELEEKSIRDAEIAEAKDLKEKWQKFHEIYDGMDIPEEILDETVPMNAEELVAMNMPKRGLNWEGFERGGTHVRGVKEELGVDYDRKFGKNTSTSAFEPFLAKKGQGKGAQQFIHDVWENQGPGKHFTEEEVRDAFINLLTSVTKPSDITYYVVNNRSQLASQIVEDRKREEENAAREAAAAEAQARGLTLDELLEEDELEDNQEITDEPQEEPKEEPKLSDEEVEGIINSMKSNADVSPEVEITDENWRGSVETPLGTVKMGENQKSKLFVRGREQQYGMLLETLTDPNIVLEEMDKEKDMFHERPSSYLFVKTFTKPDGTKYVHFESVTVSQDGMEVSISSHIIRENQLRSKLKSDRLLYKATALDKTAISSAEQPTNTGGSHSSESKDNTKSDKKQEKTEKSLSREEYLTSHKLTEEQIMADAEATEDEKLNAIDFLNGEDESAISRFYYDSIYNRAQKKSTEPTSNPLEAVEQASKDRDNWNYDFHYDNGKAWITRHKTGAGIPITDGRWRIEGNSLSELRDILENPANNLSQVLNAVEAPLSNAEATERMRTSKRSEQKAKDKSDIDEALKEFNDFLDNAKGNSILEKFMRKGLEGNDKAQASLLDAFSLTNEEQRMFLKDLLRLASKVGYAYAKSGIHDAQAWSKQMVESIGSKLKEVLGWDEPIIKEFVDEVWQQKYTVDGQRMRLSEHAERLKNEKPVDNTVNVNKQENNEPEKDVSLQGDSAEYANREYELSLLRKDIRAELDGIVMWGDKPEPMSTYKRLAKERGFDNLSSTDLQEIVESVIVSYAREIANKERWSDEQKYKKIVKLYEGQPSLNARDNDRINLQQYSTPAPMAYLMGLFTSKNKDVKSGLEPSAGNGMLTINLPKEVMHVNDIDEMRLSNLQKQGFKEVTNQDGLKSFGEKKYDVIVTNPPFGNIPAKIYHELYEISGLEHQMSINALDAMKDDGRAAIIVGGNTEYNQNGTIKGKDRAFLNYLYSHYNVVDVINMDGKSLYSRQGTGFPVRMILIDGRKEYDQSFAPVQSKAMAEQVKSFDELYKRVNDDILSNRNESAGVHDTESGESTRVDDSGNAGTSTQTGVRNVRTGGSSRESQPLAEGGQRVSGSTEGTRTTESKGRELATEQDSDNTVGRGTVVANGSGEQSSQSDRGTSSRTNEGGSISERRDNTERPDGRNDKSERLGQRRSGTAQQDAQSKRGLSTEKVPYKKQSDNPFTLNSLMPAEQADEVKKILEKLGDVDQFLVTELGYSSKEELHNALAAEQIDSVAMAIDQMNQGNAFIIGDMTGIGKGRQAAALIRYAVKKGGNPVFITVKKALFSDMYRDLRDIGSADLKPFIWCASDKDHSENITDEDGKVIYKWDEKEQTRVRDYINKNGKLPKEYDYIVTTYDGFKSGTIDYENGQRKARNLKKAPGATALNGQARRDALENLARNSYVIMDESHNAGGDKSNISKFLQYITVRTKGTTFLSATFAKRPENMPIYALRTAISKAGVEVLDLIDAVKRGGATFQEIMSKALTGAGQMIRRERDMTGVTIDWKGIEDEKVVEKQREQYDQVISLFNEIIDFQRTYIDPIINKMNDDAAEVQGDVDHTPGTRDMGINNTPFASRTYNIVQQVLLSLKAEETARRAIEHIKAGRKPVIAVANTNEGASEEASTGEDMVMPDLSVNLIKGLQGTLRIQVRDAFGNKKQNLIEWDSLPKEAQDRYREIEEHINSASTGLSLSPIDVIKNELKKAGYKIGELTGRKAEFVYNNDGTVKRVNREETDKKKIAVKFNSGEIDALIMNRSAGTGISLHASSKFKDQRQRVMIVAQAQGDVNDEVQMRGRIDRTGQVLRGMYEYVVSQIPSEQRLLMMLKAKLRSLDANTTSSQKSKFNEMNVQDVMNKYGDQILVQYLAEHPDTYSKMADPLKWGDKVYEQSPEELVSSAQKPEGDGATASKILGRMALLKVAEQEQMLDDISELYQAEIDRLNEMGENDLEITEMPLNAKTIKKDVWEQGIEPGGNNPFADNTYIEKVTMDVLKKPMKAADIKKAQNGLLDGKTWDEFKQSVIDGAEEWAKNKKDETTETITKRSEKKANAEKERYQKAAKKAQDKNGLTDEDIEKNAGYQYNNVYNSEMEKLQPALDAIDKQKQVFLDAVELFTTDGVYAIPTNIYDLSAFTFEPSFGKLIDIKISSNYSTNASTLSFATLDGRRKITIPINGMVKQLNNERRNIFPTMNTLTAQVRHNVFGVNVANTLKVLEQNPDNWDRLTSTATRKDGYIITGNLLKALVSTREQSLGGRLISFTTDTGEVRQGILMSDQFEPAGLTSKTPISSAKDQLRYNGDKIVSADGDITIKQDGWGGWSSFILTVPKSKKKGEKYFNDKTLLSLVDGQFEGSSKLRADFKRENLDAVLKRLDELGVTVAETVNNDGTRMRTESESSEITSKEMEDDGTRLRIVDDEDLINELESGGKITVYRAMQLQNGQLYPPMAAKVNGKWQDPLPLNKWSQAEEHPELVDKNGKFNLDKGNGKMVRGVVYAPYMHGSTTMLNDQFKEAQDRPELVVVEAEMPESELTSGYQAEKSPRKTGMLDWKAGTIQGQLTGTRQVMLSRWVKPVRIVPSSEVAASIKEMIDGQVEVMPTNVVTPEQREELEKLGVKFVKTDNKEIIQEGEHKGEQYSSAYGKKSNTRLRVNTETNAPANDIIPHLQKLAKKLNTPIVFHNDTSDITNRKVLDALNRRRKVKGWFDPKDNSVHFYMPNVTSRYDAERTIWHEVAGHKGMRDLLGEDGYKTFLRKLYLDRSEEFEPMHDWLKEHLPDYNFNIYEAMDEYFAYEVAEKKAPEKFWDKVKMYLKDVLIKLGFINEPNITDLKYMLWLSVQNLKDGNPLDSAKKNAMRAKLEREGGKVIDYKYYFREAARMRTDFMPNDVNEKLRYENALYKAGYVWSEAHHDYMLAFKELMNAIANGRKIEDSCNAYMYENLSDSKIRAAEEMYQRNFCEPVQVAIENCLSKIGGDKEDAYLAFETYAYKKHGLERNREFYVRDWLEKMRSKRPSTKRLNEEAKEDYEKALARIETDFEDGIIKTEEEKKQRQDEALRDIYSEMIQKVEDGWHREKDIAFENLDKGSTDFREYLQNLDNYIIKNMNGKYKPVDYSGLTDMGVKEYNDDDIINNVLDMEDMVGKGLIRDFWAKMNNLTRFAVETEYDSGLVDRKNRNRVMSMFHFYLPLRKWDADTAQDVWQYINSKGSDFVGKTIMKAKGRKSRAAMPIATAFAMGDNAITRSARNEVKKSFARFIDKYENGGLVTKMESWIQNVGTDDKPEWVEVYPDISENATGDEVADAIEVFKEKMNALRRDGKAMKLKERGRIEYRFAPKSSFKEHCVEVWIGGEKHVYVVNGNPRAAQAINGMLRPESKFGNLWNNLKQFMSQAFTSWSPSFTARNLIRDAEYASSMLNVKEGWDYTQNFMKNYLKLTDANRMADVRHKDTPMMFMLFSKYRKGTLNETNKIERYFKEFVENGGVTGYVDAANAEKWRKRIINSFEDQNWAEKIVGAVKESVEHINEAVENTARFATFVTSRESGRTVAKSAYDAKEVSVNFNRKGSGAKAAGFKNEEGKTTTNAWIAGWLAQYLRETHLFYNASLQGLANTIKNAVKNPARFIPYVAASPFIMGATIPVLNAFIHGLIDDDDDDVSEDPYADLPEYTRRQNICIYTGKGKFITIPLAIEMRAFYGLGDIIAGYTYDEKLKSIDKNIAEDAVTALGNFSPIDVSAETGIGDLLNTGGVVGQGLNAITPSQLTGLIDVSTNKRWTGRPIQKETPFNELDPEFTKSYEGTNKVLIIGSDYWHRLWGGDDVRRAGKKQGSKSIERVGEWSPAKAEYLIQQYLGEMGGFTTTVANVKSVATGKTPFNARMLPVVKAFISQGDERTQFYRAKDKYYKYLDQFKEVEHEESGYKKKKNDPVAYLDNENLKKETRYKAYEIYKKNYKKDLDKLRKEEKDAKDLAEKREYRRQQNVLIETLVDNIEAMEYAVNENNKAKKK